MTSRWLRLLGGVAILVGLAWWVGAGAFVEGLRGLQPAQIIIALLVDLTGTLSCAWRWRHLAGRLGHELPLKDAVIAFYRSQFLNAVLPLGIAGDVHRAVRHGPRSVVLDKAAGLAAQFAVAAVALLALPSPVPWFIPLGVAVVAGGALVALARRAWGVVLVSSGLLLAGHVAVFALAAHTIGASAGLPTLIGLSLLALMATALPLSLAGFGPREGAAAWAFGAAGLGASTGVAASVAFGVLSLVGVLPGALTLLVRIPRPAAEPEPEPA